MSSDGQSDSWSIFKRLYTYLSHNKLIFLIAIIGNLTFSGMNYLFARSLEPLTNEALVKGDMTFLTMAPFFIVAIILVRGLANFVSAYSMAWVGQRVVENIRLEMIAHYMRLPSCFFDTNPSGTLVSKVTYDTQQIASATTDAITKLLREGALIGYILYYLFTTSWRLALLFLLAAPIIGIVVQITSKRFKAISHNIQQAMGAITQKAQEIIDGQRVIKAFGSESLEQKQFASEASYNRHQNIKMVATKSVSVAIIQLIAGLFLALVLYVASQELAQEQITPGQFVTMLTMMMLMLKPLKTISNLNSVFQTGVAAAESVFKIIDEEKETDVGTITLGSTRTKIEFKNISFSYGDKNRPVLNDISLVANPGQTVALVGRSGSGKSTLVNLLMRFYNSNNGKILLDDIDISELTLQSLRSHISSVSQQVTLFNASVTQNIAYGCDSDFDLERVKSAAIQAHAWEFIEKLPLGLDESIGENGNKLSGGQRQRLAIARALYKDAPIVLLDEATSALDTESERHIHAALDSLTKSRTSIVIAHRLSTVENADLIIVMDEGSVVEQGTHKALLAESGVYANLYKMQFKQEA